MFWTFFAYNIMLCKLMVGELHETEGARQAPGAMVAYNFNREYYLTFQSLALPD